MASQVELYREANELGIVVAQKLLVMAKPWEKGVGAPDPLFDEDGLVPGSLAGLKSLGGIKRPAKKLAMSTIANDPGKVFEAAFVMVAKIIWTAIRLFFLTLRKIFNV